MPSCSAPVSSSIGVLVSLSLTSRKATSWSWLAEASQAWSVNTRVTGQMP